MRKSIKKVALGMAVAGALGLGATGAQADALAVSVNLINNLQFLNAATGTALAFTDFSAVVYTNSADTLASIGSTTDSHSGIGTPLDLYSCVGGANCPANNTYPTLGPPATATFATADQNEFGAPISGLPGGAPLGATVNVASYASTIDGSDPSGQSNNGLSSTFTFTLDQTMGVTISFNNTAYLDAWTAPTEVFPTNALASYSTCFTITPVGGTSPIVSWCPNGQVGGNTGITAETDPYSLNASVSRNAPFNGNTSTGVQTGAFSATTIPLLAGVAYQLSARQTSSADALEVRVPEPSTLALLGVGLFAVSALRRRKS